jgi:hypothetical protein
MSEKTKGPKPYREGDQPEHPEQSGIADKDTGEDVKPITAVLVVLTDDGVDMISDIKGINVQRRATFHDVVMMASAINAEATARISSQYTAEAMMKSMAIAQRAMVTTPPSQGPMTGPGGVPIIGRGGPKRGL